MTRPTSNPLFATNVDYAAGVDTGTPTKSVPTAGERADGFRGDVGADSQIFNNMLGVHGDFAKLAGALDFNFSPINVLEFGPSTLDKGAFAALGFKPDPNLATPIADRFIVAHATAADVFRSPDGITWQTNGEVNAEVTGIEHPKGLFYSQVAGLFIYGPKTGTPSGNLYTSPTGATWTVRVDPSAVGDNHGGFAERTTGSAIIVGTTGDDMLWSTDGLTWNAETNPAAGLMRSAVYSPALDLFIAVGVGGRIVSSPDGKVWTDRTTGSAALEDVAWDSVNSQFVACGDAAAVWRSSDGTTWTDVGLEVPLTGQDFTSIVSDGGGTLYMAGDNFVLRSIDGGSNWEVVRVTSNLFPPFFVGHFDNRPYLFGASLSGGTDPAISIGMQVAPIAIVTP